MIVELDKKTSEEITSLARLANLSEVDTIRGMYYWLLHFYKNLNGSIGSDVRAALDAELKKQGKQPLKHYCTQNHGDCSTCSLKNYNRDCHNHSILP